MNLHLQLPHESSSLSLPFFFFLCFSPFISFFFTDWIFFSRDFLIFGLTFLLFHLPFPLPFLPLRINLLVKFLCEVHAVLKWLSILIQSWLLFLVQSQQLNLLFKSLNNLVGHLAIKLIRFSWTLTGLPIDKVNSGISLIKTFFLQLFNLLLIVDLVLPDSFLAIRECFLNNLQRNVLIHGILPDCILIKYANWELQIQNSSYFSLPIL